MMLLISCTLWHPAVISHSKWIYACTWAFVCVCAHAKKKNTHISSIYMCVRASGCLKSSFKDEYLEIHKMSQRAQQMISEKAICGIVSLLNYFFKNNTAFGTNPIRWYYKCVCMCLSLSLFVCAYKQNQFQCCLSSQFFFFGVENFLRETYEDIN